MQAATPFPRAQRPPAAPVAEPELVLNPASLLTAEASRAAILAHYHTGTGNGETTHFPDVDKNWTWKRGELTCVTGYPNHGKSEWVIQMMVIKAAFDGWKFALFCPENFPAEELFTKIIQMYIGRSANFKDGHKRMSLEELDRGLAFAHEHFFLLAPNEDEEMSPATVLAYFDHLHKAHGIDGVLVDPWNQLDHDDTGGIRSDQYLRKWLTKLKRFAQKRQLCFVYTAHPAGDVTDRATGELKVPKAYNISDGKMHNNKCDNVLAIHRPKFPASTVDLHIHKIKKWGLVGKAGIVYLDFLPEQFRYYAPAGSPSPLNKLPGSTSHASAPAPVPYERLPLPPSQFDQPTAPAPFAVAAQAPAGMRFGTDTTTKPF